MCPYFCMGKRLPLLYEGRNTIASAGFAEAIASHSEL